MTTRNAVLINSPRQRKIAERKRLERRERILNKVYAVILVLLVLASGWTNY